MLRVSCAREASEGYLGLLLKVGHGIDLAVATIV